MRALRWRRVWSVCAWDTKANSRTVSGSSQKSWPTSQMPLSQVTCRVIRRGVAYCTVPGHAGCQSPALHVWPRMYASRAGLTSGRPTFGEVAHMRKHFISILSVVLTAAAILTLVLSVGADFIGPID